jgi:hypothetical protein
MKEEETETDLRHGDVFSRHEVYIGRIHRFAKRWFD